MSEANILNTSSASQLNPWYGWQEERLQNLAQMVAQSGKWFGRRVGPEPVRYALHWNLDSTNKFLLQQWARQYAAGFFTLVDWEATRYFSGRFANGVRFTLVGNNNWDADAVFEELPTLALSTYPSNWARDAIFLEERNDFGEDLVKLLTPANWTYEVFASHHAGAAYYSSVTNEIAEWQYFGYGVQVWAVKAPNRGIVEVTHIRVRDSAIISGPINIDPYAAATEPSAPIFTATNIGLDLYRVKLRVTGTKNASSSGFFVSADAIQVMQ